MNPLRFKIEAITDEYFRKSSQSSFNVIVSFISVFKICSTTGKETYLGKLDIVTKYQISKETLTCIDLDLHGIDLNNKPRLFLGVSGLNQLVQFVMEEVGVQELVIQGGIRSSGLRRGAKPREKRYRR